MAVVASPSGSIIISLREGGIDHTKRLMGLTRTVYMDKISLNPGALGAEETRQSIPNLAVKLCCGDNTAGGALWEDSSAPGLLIFFPAYCPPLLGGKRS